MLDSFEAQQDAAALQQLDDQRVGLEDLLAFVFRQSIAQDSAVIHIAVQVKTVLHSGIKVVSAMSRRRMHRAGARCPW